MSGPLFLRATVPSRAVLERLGFVEEGRQRGHYFVEGEYVDRRMCGLFADERTAENWEPPRTEPQTVTFQVVPEE